MAGGELSERGKCESSEKSPYDVNIFLTTRYKQQESKSVPQASARCRSLSSTAPKPTNRKIRKKKKKTEGRRQTQSLDTQDIKIQRLCTQKGKHIKARNSYRQKHRSQALRQTGRHKNLQTHRSKTIRQANTQNQTLCEP